VVQEFEAGHVHGVNIEPRQGHLVEDIEFRACRFVGNKYGMTIQKPSSRQIRLSQCHFTNNIHGLGARLGPSQITVQGCTFEDNSGRPLRFGQMGSGVVIDGNTIDRWSNDSRPRPDDGDRNHNPAAENNQLTLSDYDLKIGGDDPSLPSELEWGSPSLAFINNRIRGLQVWIYSVDHGIIRWNNIDPRKLIIRMCTNVCIGDNDLNDVTVADWPS
jgi:hypothetical protein